MLCFWKLPCDICEPKSDVVWREADSLKRCDQIIAGEVRWVREVIIELLDLDISTEKRPRDHFEVIIHDIHLCVRCETSLP